MKKLIPADTVDSEGTAWETIGENIRNGAKNFPSSSIEAIAEAIVNVLFPVGSIYCGENSYLLSIGKWEKIVTGVNRAFFESDTIVTGAISNSPYLVMQQQQNGLGVALRIYKRIS